MTEGFHIISVPRTWHTSVEHLLALYIRLHDRQQTVPLT
jgi:hypothetical protein